jgi:hypothetical protein
LESCESVGGIQYVEIDNNSAIEISFYPYSLWPISLRNGRFYPDTLLKDTISNVMGVFVNIPPHSSRSIETSFNQREIKKGLIPFESDTLMLFLFSTDTLRKYSWEEIKRFYKVLKRYDITGRELNNYNWTLTYP